MNDTKFVSDVVVAYDPNTEPIIWKDIPGYSTYQASESGAIRRKVKYGWRYNKFSLHKTSKGTYLRTSAMADVGNGRSKGVHVLVCLAFHGLPPDDGLRYEVNHKDGNKHNNHYLNLHWSTRSDNLLHAYENNLRTESRVVTVVDDIENTKVSYVSISAAARQLNIDKGDFRRLIERYPFSEEKHDKWLNRYSFVIGVDKTLPSRYSSNTQVYSMDITTGVVSIYTDSLSAHLATGVKRMTILARLRNQSILPAGIYVFSKELDNLPPKNYYSEADLKRYFTEFNNRSKWQTTTASSDEESSP